MIRTADCYSSMAPTWNKRVEQKHKNKQNQDAAVKSAIIKKYVRASQKISKAGRKQGKVDLLGQKV